MHTSDSSATVVPELRAELRPSTNESGQLPSRVFTPKQPSGSQPGHFELLEGTGRSPVMQAVLNQIRKFAPTSLSILVRGESGTGKELASQAIHALSHRNGKLVPVPAPVLQDTNASSTLFGTVKCAYTGAVDRPGLFEEANGGTLFFDEIGDLTPAVQAMLLRALQEREFCRDGSNRPIAVNVRVLAATNRDLEALCHEGSFRKDLYYRLNGATVHLPALRARGDDIQLIAEHFAQRSATEHGKAPCRFSEDALQFLREHSWPGNVRELEYAVQRAFVFAKPQGAAGIELTAGHFQIAQPTMTPPTVPQSSAQPELTALFFEAMSQGQDPFYGVRRGDRYLGPAAEHMVRCWGEAARYFAGRRGGTRLTKSIFYELAGVPARAAGHESALNERLRDEVDLLVAQ